MADVFEKEIVRRCHNEKGVSAISENGLGKAQHLHLIMGIRHFFVLSHDVRRGRTVGVKAGRGEMAQDEPQFAPVAEKQVEAAGVIGDGVVNALGKLQRSFPRRGIDGGGSACGGE